MDRYTVNQENFVIGACCCSVSHQLSTTTYYRPLHYTNYQLVVSKQLREFTNTQGKDCLMCYLFGTLTMYWRQEIKRRKAHSVVKTNWHKKPDKSPGAWCGKMSDWRSSQCQRGSKRRGEWRRPVFYLLDCTIYSTKYIILDGWNTSVALIHEKASFKVNEFRFRILYIIVTEKQV